MGNRNRVGGGIAASAASVLVLIALTGCVPAVDAAGPTPTSGTEKTSPQVAESTPITTPMPTPTPTPTAAFAPVDSGPREGANGQVVLGDAGSLEAYIATDGDKLIDISFRFGVDVTELTTANGARHSYNDGDLYPGEFVLFRADGAPPPPVYQPPLTDSGSREHATGEVVVDDAGNIVEYVVADGDLGDDIGLRLGTDAQHIYHDAGEFAGRNILNWGEIYPGDVLRFTAEK